MYRLNRFIQWVFVLALFYPVWLFRFVLDTRPIAWPFNSLTLYLPEVVALGLVFTQSRWSWRKQWLTVALSVIAAYTTLSIAWALDYRLAMVTAASWWLVVGVSSVVQTPSPWLLVAIVCGQAVIGGLQVGTGNIQVLGDILRWGINFHAGEQWASYLLNAVGQPLLRAYGTMEHPNHLGGYMAALVLLLMGVFWARPQTSQRQKIVLGIGMIAAVIGLGLTFSRGAWLAFGVAAIYLMLCNFKAAPSRTVWLFGLLVLISGLFLIIFQSWIIQRVLPSQVWLEQKSLVDRAALTSDAWRLITRFPWGVGAGNYVQAAVQYLASNLQAPVHNTILMAGGELGLIGIVLVSGLYGLALWQAWQARHDPWRAACSAALLALLIANSFDLYMWGLPPNRLFLGFLCGLVQSATLEQAGG